MLARLAHAQHEAAGTRIVDVRVGLRTVSEDVREQRFHTAPLMHPGKHALTLTRLGKVRGRYGTRTSAPRRVKATEHSQAIRRSNASEPLRQRTGQLGIDRRSGE